MDLDTREAIIRVPVSVRDAFGKESAGDLVVTTFRPPGTGPFPLVILSHGRDTATRAEYKRQRFETAARFFVRKGFAVAVPLRLGYGELASAGDPEDNMGCDSPRYSPAVDAAALEVLAVARKMQAEPDIDPARLVLVGQSVGGFTTVAAAAMRPAGLVAAINFAGGHGGNPKTMPGEPCKAYLIERAMGTYGATTQVPSLWVYTENDKYFSPRNSTAWQAAFAKAGGKVEYKLMPVFGDDGHQLFARGADQWQPLVDSFLAQHGFAQSGTLSAPAPTSFAKLDDVAALTGTDAKGRVAYASFLGAAQPRAFAIGADRRVGWATGDDAMSRALAFCQRRSARPCKLYAVNDNIVWKP